LAFKLTFGFYEYPNNRKSRPVFSFSGFFISLNKQRRIISVIYVMTNADKQRVDMENKDSSEALRERIAFLEKELSLPITVVSVGPDRKQTIPRS
jgi:adenylosuccinate synthase